MNKRKLLKDLNNLCNEMSFSYNINCGGCCFVAAVIAEQLENYNIPFSVAYREFPTHYAIKLKDRYINRDGFHFNNFYDWNSNYLYEIYYMEDWNYCYNRKWNLIVKTRIKSIFRKYGNSI